MKKTLLITARDAAAALHLIQVAAAYRARGDYWVHIVAQMPAARYFMNAGFQVKIFPDIKVLNLNCDEAVKLLSAAREILKTLSPDIVLVGLSTPFDAGIDEAILLESKVPTILYQDFWGEQNLLLGKSADKVLAIDEEARLLNLERFGIKSAVVGSARHAPYQNLNMLDMRRNARTRLGVRENENIVGFFGQALQKIPGYIRTIEVFISTLSKVDVPFRLIVRPHPREDGNQREMTLKLFERSGIEPIVDDGNHVEETLIASDIVCSLFSTCTYDAAYINRFSNQPMAVPISMLFDEEVLAYCQKNINFDTFPYHHSGIIKAVMKSGDLAKTLNDAFEPSFRKEVWLSAHRELPNPVGAAQRVLAEIDEMLKII